MDSSFLLPPEVAPLLSHLQSSSLQESQYTTTLTWHGITVFVLWGDFLFVKKQRNL